MDGYSVERSILNKTVDAGTSAPLGAVVTADEASVLRIPGCAAAAIVGVYDVRIGFSLTSWIFSFAGSEMLVGTHSP